jgi:hypothetical protein
MSGAFFYILNRLHIVSLCRIFFVKHLRIIMKKLILLFVSGILMAMEDEGARLVSLPPATQEAIYKATDGTHGLQPTKQDDMSRSIKTSGISAPVAVGCCCGLTGLACLFGGAFAFSCPASTAAALNAQVAARIIGTICGAGCMCAGAQIGAGKCPGNKK